MGPRKVSRKRDSVSIKAGEFVIKPTETEKLLGCNLHQSMQWNSHIKDHSKSVIRQITTRVNGLRKISQNAICRTRLMIANGAVLSKLVYIYLFIYLYNLHDSLEYTLSSLEIHHKEHQVNEPLVLRLL